MKTQTYCVCEKCNEPILNETQGFIIQGNIYVANPNEAGGIIGDNFPEENEESLEQLKFTRDEVNQVAYHKGCLFSLLNDGI